MTSEFSVAVHCLVYLRHRNCCLSSEKIAENVCTNPARIRKILAKLGAAGLIRSREGLSGGFELNGDAGAMTLDRVLEALGERFICVNWKSGREEMPCVIASGMAGVMDDLFGELNELCKRRLGEISISQVEAQIFRRKNRKTV